MNVLTISLSLMLLVGCSSKIQKQQELNVLSDHNGIDISIPTGEAFRNPKHPNERLLERAFKGHKFTEEIPSMFDTGTEIMVQGSLDRLKKGGQSYWTNEKYGKITLYPGHSIKINSADKCREFKVTKENNKQTGSGIVCFNQQTEHWVWVNGKETGRGWMK